MVRGGSRLLPQRPQRLVLPRFTFFLLQGEDFILDAMFNGDTKAVNAVRGLLQGIVIQRAIDEMFHDRCVSCSHT